MLGNRALDRIVWGIAMVVTILTTGIFVYTEMIYIRKLPQEKEEVQELLANTKQKSKVTGALNIDRLVLNMPSTESRMRYIEIGVSCRPFKEEQVSVLNSNKEMVMDAVIVAVGRFQSAELATITGKLLLEERIKNGINSKLGKDVVKEVFFTRFVVQ